MERGGSVYILTNKTNKVFYTGVTSDLRSRIFEHKTKAFPNSFSARYNLDKLVYFETFHSIEEAIEREKQIKGGSRAKKVKLIQGMNPTWADLWEEINSW